MTRFTEGRITNKDSKKKEIVCASSGQKKHGFRNMKDMFAAIKEDEDAIQMQDQDGMSENEPDSPASSSSGSAESSCGGKSDGVQGELSKEEQMHLHAEMLSVIKQFTKLNNIKENEYYGVTKKQLNTAKRNRQRQIELAALQKEKEKAALEEQQK